MLKNISKILFLLALLIATSNCTTQKKGLEQKETIFIASIPERKLVLGWDLQSNSVPLSYLVSCSNKNTGSVFTQSSASNQITLSLTELGLYNFEVCSVISNSVSLPCSLVWWIDDPVLKISYEDGSILLNWTAIPNSSYDIQNSYDGGESWHNFITDLQTNGDTSIIIQDLTNNMVWCRLVSRGIGDEN